MGSLTYTRNGGDEPVLARLRSLGCPENTKVDWGNPWTPQFRVGCQWPDGVRHAVLLARNVYHTVTEDQLAECASALKEWYDGQVQASPEAAS